MIEFINKFTGTKMYVADERKEEYIAAGHELAADPAESVEQEKPKRATRKRKEA